MTDIEREYSRKIFADYLAQDWDFYQMVTQNSISRRRELAMKSLINQHKAKESKAVPKRKNDETNEQPMKNLKDAEGNPIQKKEKAQVATQFTKTYMTEVEGRPGFWVNNCNQDCVDQYTKCVKPIFARFLLSSDHFREIGPSYQCIFRQYATWMHSEITKDEFFKKLKEDNKRLELVWTTQCKELHVIFFHRTQSYSLMLWFGPDNDETRKAKKKTFTDFI